MKITNKLNLPKIFVDIVESEYTYKENRYSVTELLNGIREINLTRKHYEELEQDVADMSNLIFGSAVHKLFELADKENAEVKLEAKVGNKVLSGQFDKLDGYTLIDYKTAKVYKIKKEDFEDWRKQGLMYAWLCKQNGILVDKVKFIVLLKDWSLRSGLESGIYVYEFKVTTLDLIDIEDWIKERLLLVDTDTPCTTEERWRTDDKWAVMKEGGKRAIKVYDNEKDAQESLKDGLYVEYRPGDDVKCDNYCKVNMYCEYYRGK